MKILGRGFLQILFALLILLQMHASIGFYSTTADDEFRCIDRERQALLAFKQGLVDVYDLLSSWGSEEEKKECCKWEGIQCNNTTGHVTVLDLGLQGLFSRDERFPPSELGNLTNLEHLDLGGNYFNIDNLEWLSLLSYLQHLDLSENNLSKVNNYWLQVISKLPHLTYLYLGGCNLQDVIPQSIPMINTSTSLALIELRHNNLTASAFQWLSKFNNSLVSLHLAENQFRGLIPENLSHMTYLEFVHLGSNQFEGGVPKSFGNLCKLRSLYLFSNNLEGMLPELFGNLSGCLQLSLEVLYLGENKLKGPLPDMIKTFSSLQSLVLSNNKLNGTIPKSIGLLSNLRALHISSNSFNGVIIKEHFSTLSNLRRLDISSNNLSINFSRDWIPPFQLDSIGLGLCKLGPKFPSWLKTQREFSYLDISRNGISDSIPEWFWNLSSSSSTVKVNLSSNQIYEILPDLSMIFSVSFGISIDLSKNKLEGPLPVFPINAITIRLSENRFFGPISSLCTITGGKLAFLDVSGNQLSGELPDCMTQWTSLVILNLANNNLFGKIPSSIGSLYQLESLGLHNNSFFGEIPLSLRNCNALQFLDLSYNSFSGIIPAWVGERLSSLTFLLLGSNNFSGDIPLQLCWLTNMTLLDLSNNNLSGGIPRCIQNLTALAQRESSVRDHVVMTKDVNSFINLERYSDKASIMWKGIVYDYRNLKNLRIIDLSSNILTGEIPVQISVLLELVQLNLSRNQLTGSMLRDIGQLRQLESLDLSWNQLSGYLPRSMSQLNFLSTLNLSYNNFSGRIPLSTQMQSFNASVFVGNPALCGLPLTPTCPEDEKSNNKTTDSGSKDHQEDRAEFWKSFKPGVELGAAIGFVGVLAVKLDHPWKYLCFLLFNNVRVHLSNLKDFLCLLVAAVGLLVREHVSRLGRKLKLFEPSISS